eukprot:7799326-Ditylum_brightwellii.AAC.1
MGDKFNSNNKSADDREIKIDDSEAYTPVNPNINSAERRVYNLCSQIKDKIDSKEEYKMDHDDMDDVIHFALTQYSLK